MLPAERPTCWATHAALDSVRALKKRSAGTRALAQEARVSLGQEIIVVNRPGASGAIAINEVLPRSPMAIRSASLPPLYSRWRSISRISART